MADNTLSIPINSIEADFDDFLSPESNKRIIFSGPFGIGKSYFLDKFFKNREFKYLPIFLRPVNYSLLSNEDVFRLIKYDILFQIIKDRQFIFDDIPDFTKMEFTQFFASQNLFLPLVNLLKTLPKIKTLVTGAEEIEKLIKKYSDGLKQINKNEKLSILSEFRTEAETNFLLEYDHVSQLIADQLHELAKENGLQKVLIIDDLDRLDPEHIFRLFNVFSAHFDHVNYYSDGEDLKDNKFGFDKIIFVCDIENIRKLFAHKYGLGVDFSGYIDKFYSKRLYYLFQKHAFEKYISPYLDNEFQKLNLGGSLLNTINFFLQLLFQGNQLNIRDINRIGDLHLSAILTKENKFKNDEIQLNKLNAPSNAKLRNYTICTALYIFSHHFGSSSVLKDKLLNAFVSTDSKEAEYSSYKFNEIIASLVLFADYKNHKFQINGKDDLSFTYHDYAYKIVGGYEDQHYKEGLMWFRIDFIEKHPKISKGFFFKALTEASITIIDSGILNI